MKLSYIIMLVKARRTQYIFLNLGIVVCQQSVPSIIVVDTNKSGVSLFWLPASTRALALRCSFMNFKNSSKL